jgi:hypothetical protein
VNWTALTRRGEDPLGVVRRLGRRGEDPLGVLRRLGRRDGPSGPLPDQARLADTLRLVALLARDAPPPDPVVAAVLARLARDPAAPVSAHAREAGFSERQLRRRLLHGVGLGPKRLARIVRMQALLAASPRHGSWARRAVDHGWYDEAHMVHDVTLLAGASPAALLDRRSFQAGAARAA